MPEAAQQAAGTAVLVVHYGSYDALIECLDSVVEFGGPLAACVVRDQSGNEEELRKVEQRFPGVRFIRGENRGFAGGANALLADPGVQDAEFLLLLNSDVELRRGYVSGLVEALRGRPQAAMAGGKLLRSDGVTLDSAGIELPLHRRPRDRGSEEPDRGQFDREERMFGVSGAAVLIRRASAVDLAIDGELFDEDFFVYHEDTDLAWRAGLLSWEVLYVPAAVAIHGRGWQKRGRFDVPVWVRRHSFKNHYLQMIKNERGRDFLKALPVLIAWEVLRLGFAVVRDPAILPAYGQALSLAPRMLGKRRILQRRVSERERSGGRTELPRSSAPVKR